MIAQAQRTQSPNTGQVAVLTTPTAVRGLNPRRTALAITNLGPAVVYLSYRSDLSVNTGFGLPSGAGIVLEHAAPLYCIAAATGSTISWLEENQ